MSASQQDINPEAFGLSRFHEVEAGRPVLDSEEEEGLAKEFPQVSFVLGDRMDQGQGTLFITSRFVPVAVCASKSLHLLLQSLTPCRKHRRIIWLASQDHKHGYAAAFQNINMHAIYSSAQRPCIYMQMEPSTSPFTDEEPEDAEDDEEKTPEVMLVPADASTCARPPRIAYRPHFGPINMAHCNVCARCSGRHV
jgi:hypothetical protein